MPLNPCADMNKGCEAKTEYILAYISRYLANIPLKKIYIYIYLTGILIRQQEEADIFIIHKSDMLTIGFVDSMLRSLN